VTEKVESRSPGSRTKESTELKDSNENGIEVENAPQPSRIQSEEEFEVVSFLFLPFNM
jgi:hypothetical protein